jgi:hypothetical protein
LSALPEISSLSRNLLEATLRQAEKDLTLPELSLPQGEVSEQMQQMIWNHVYDGVYQLVNQKPSELQQAFYRVDLSEKQFREALASADQVHQLTEFVLKRSLQKVVMRKRYSS